MDIIPRHDTASSQPQAPLDTCLREANHQDWNKNIRKQHKQHETHDAQNQQKINVPRNTLAPDPCPSTCAESTSNSSAFNMQSLKESEKFASVFIVLRSRGVRRGVMAPVCPLVLPPRRISVMPLQNRESCMNARKITTGLMLLHTR